MIHAQQTHTQNTLSLSPQEIHLDLYCSLKIIRPSILTPSHRVDDTDRHQTYEPSTSLHYQMFQTSDNFSQAFLLKQKSPLFSSRQERKQTRGEGGDDGNLEKRWARIRVVERGEI